MVVLHSLRCELLPDLIPVAYRHAVYEFLNQMNSADAGVRRRFPTAADFQELVLSTGAPAPTLPLAKAYVAGCLARREFPDAQEMLRQLLKGIPQPRTR